MPKYYEDKEEDSRACAGIREDFKACLLQHECVVKEGKNPSECLKEGHCRALQTSFFECKRSMVSNKLRFCASRANRVSVNCRIRIGAFYLPQRGSALGPFDPEDNRRLDTRSRFRGRKGY